MEMDNIHSDLIDEAEEEIEDTQPEPQVLPEQIAHPRTEPQQPGKGKKAPYRALSIPERDFLYALYEKYNGNMSHMVLDPECPLKAYNAIRYWAKLYHFYERMVENRRKRAENFLAKMQDAKLMAIERAMEMLRPYVSFVYTKTGVQVYDREGKPLVIEKQPYYKEVKAAWEIIKAELGEPTTVSKTDITSKGEAISSVKVTVVNGTGPASNSGIQPQPAEHEAHQGEPGGNGQQ